jgi:hypothetical protein
LEWALPVAALVSIPNPYGAISLGSGCMGAACCFVPLPKRAPALTGLIEWRDRRPDLLTERRFGKPKVVRALEVHPELGTSSQKVPEADRRICGDRSLTAQNLRDPICGYLDPPAKLRGAQVELAQLIGQNLTRMNCWS